MLRRILVILGVILLVFPRLLNAQSDKNTIDWIYFLGTDGSIYRIQINGGNLQQLSDDEGREASMMLSPEGMWIIGLSYREGSYNIYRMRPDGLEFSLLTHSQDIERNPVWSADGQTIFYTVERENGGYELHSISLDGSTVKTLIELTDLLAPNVVGWSADGEWLLLDDDAQALYRIHPDGTNLEAVFTQYFVFGYQYSPSLTQFGYVSLSGDGSYDIHIRPNYDNEEETIYPVDAGGSFVWSADEQIIYFRTVVQTETGYPFQLHTLDVANEEVTLLIGNPDFIYNVSLPQFTSDGEWMIVVVQLDELTYRLYRISTDELTAEEISEVDVESYSDFLLYSEELES